MGADQIAELRPPISEVFAAAAAGEAWCAAFSVDGDADRWVEVTRDLINIAYSSERDPSTVLVSHPDHVGSSVRLTSWEPLKYATFAFPRDLSARDVARLVDLFIQLLLHPKNLDYSVDAKLFPLAT